MLHLKSHIDLMLCLLLAVHAVVVTIHHLDRGERVLAFWGYLFFATFWTYGYLGEKVPWLSSYPLISGLIYLTLYFDWYFKEYPANYSSYSVGKIFLFLGLLASILGVWFVAEERIILDNQELGKLAFENIYLLVLGPALIATYFIEREDPFLGRCNLGLCLLTLVCIYNFRASIQTNFLYAGKETEFISQVHTTQDLAEVALRIKSEIKYEKNSYRPKILVEGEATWPLTWYFRDLPEYKFSATPEERKSFTYIFQDFKEQPTAGDIPPEYYSRKMNLRGWWVPEYDKMTLKRFLNYSINHYPWSGSGFSYTVLLTAKDTARFKDAAGTPQ